MVSTKNNSPQTKTTEQFIQESIVVHKNRYNYDLVDYKNSYTYVSILCEEHGIFEQKPNKHLRGHGCPKCANNQKITTEEFIEKCRTIHGDKFEYSLTIYKDAKTKVTLICREHGIFEQMPRSHLIGTGCPKCGYNRIGQKNRKSSEEFLTDVREVHGNLYDYRLINYKHSHSNVTVICPVHGDFTLRASALLRGQGCPCCGFENSGYNSSSNEKKWLSSLNIPELISSFVIKSDKLKRRFVVDGYDPKTNTVYLFHGDFWHGNPEIYDPSLVNPRVKVTMGDLYHRTLHYESQLRELGFNLVVMWENEWNQTN